MKTGITIETLNRYGSVKGKPNTDEALIIRKQLGLIEQSICGKLDGWELGDNSEVVPRSEVISDLKEILEMIQLAKI